METTQTPRMDAVPLNPEGSQGIPDKAGSVATLLRYIKVLAERVVQLSAELRQSRQDLGSIETALVGRIADVDDERRRSETRIQRMLRSQRDEFDGLLRQQTRLLALAMVLINLLLAGGIAFALYRLQNAQQALELELRELRQGLPHLGQTIAAADPELRAQIERLSLAVAEISRALKQLPDKPTPQGLDLRLQGAPAEPSTPHAPEASAAETREGVTLAQINPPADSLPIEDQGSGSGTPPIPPQDQGGANQAPEVKGGPSDGPPVAEGPLALAEPKGPKPPSPQPEAGLGQAQPDAAALDEIRPQVSEALAERPPDSQSPDSLAQVQSQVAIRRIQVGDRRFTLQLIGFHNLQTLERFVADNPLPMVYYYREESYQGRPWFVLIHSLHPTREAAESAVASLPPQLARLNLWIRRLKPETELIEVQRLRP